MYSQGWKGHNVKACIQSDVKPLPASHSPFTHTLQSLHVQLLGSEGPGNIQDWCYLTQVPIIQVLQIGLVVRCLIVEVCCWLVSEYREYHHNHHHHRSRHPFTIIIVIFIIISASSMLNISVASDMQRPTYVTNSTHFTQRRKFHNGSAPICSNTC